MINSITIRNFGLIDDLSLELGAGLNALSGETGAGKSIIIDALRICLGARMNSSQIRDSGQPCILEVVFDLSIEILEQNSLVKDFLSQEETSLIISRVYTSDGKNKIKINGLSAAVAQLKEIGSILIDLHGPHDHQMLLARESHIGMLDRLSGINDLLALYRGSFDRFTELNQQLQEIQRNTQSRERELDTIAYQLKELSQVDLNQEKYFQSLTEQTRLNNTEELCRRASEIIGLLEDDNSGLEESIRKIFVLMNKLNRVDETTNDFTRDLNLVQEASNQLLSKLNEYAQSLNFDSGQAVKINKTCDIYNSLLRKYGPEIKDVFAFFNQAQQRHEFLINLEHSDKELKQEKIQLEKELSRIAEQISAKRFKTTKSLKNIIEKELLELGFNKVIFDCKIEKTAFRNDGCDDLEFYISPNPGEPLRPLADIVSSGESARVMLALKKALVKADPVPVLIFDEIDAQIGGRLGTVTGVKLKELSYGRQVIVITHLPQIASFADTHYKVIKQVNLGRTAISVLKLTDSSRIKELAQMMSGSEETKISLSHAKDMLIHAQQELARV
ncbi:MAG: DNA repair protein RecN [Candidatus Omnitrophota bacterium]